jgi:hypothetical protein
VPVLQRRVHVVRGPPLQLRRRAQARCHLERGLREAEREPARRRLRRGQTRRAPRRQDEVERQQRLLRVGRYRIDLGHDAQGRLRLGHRHGPQAERR